MQTSFSKRVLFKADDSFEQINGSDGYCTVRPVSVCQKTYMLKELHKLQKDKNVLSTLALFHSVDKSAARP